MSPPGYKERRKPLTPEQRADRKRKQKVFKRELAIGIKLAREIR